MTLYNLNFWKKVSLKINNENLHDDGLNENKSRHVDQDMITNLLTYTSASNLIRTLETDLWDSLIILPT
jgi:hypothetical protein